MKLPIYMDHHATTPLDPRVLDAMMPYFTEIFGNAASIDHDFGYEAKQAVDKARDQIARSINAASDEIIFTSGATESDNIALFGTFERYADKGNHIITCVTEHKAILDAAKRIEKSGGEVTYLPVDQYGLVDPQAVEAAITDKTILISIMMANNEIGSIAPIAEIGRIAHEHGVLFHTDAAQALGHIPIDVKEMNIDIMSMSAHKIYGPKGVGGLYVRRSSPRVKLSPVIYGGGHERGIRSGTLNVPGIVGFGEAVAIAKTEMKEETQRIKDLRDRMYHQLYDQLDGVQLNGHPERRLPHNLSVYIEGVESKSLIIGLKDIAISTGSACTTANVEPSYVIKSLGYGENRAHQSIRIGLGRNNTIDESIYVIEKLVSYVKRLRNIADAINN